MQRVTSAAKKCSSFLFNSTMGFFILNVFFVWLKTYSVYQNDFSLGAKGPMQQFLLLLNPIPTAIIFISLGLYFRGKASYWTMLFMNLLQSIWLFSNVLYYREFSDFLSLNIMSSSGAAGNNLGLALGGIIKGTDFLIFADLVALVLLIAFKQIHVNRKTVRKRIAGLTTRLGVFLMFVGYGLAETDRSGLLVRTFDNNYIVKYLGLNEYAAYNIYKTQKTAEVKKQATPQTLEKVDKFVKENQTTPNPEYYGSLKGKNVIMFHLESFQQFMIDYKVDGKEVTPNINRFYHSQDSLSFDNFYNQVGQGKTADAETMLETGLYGTESGSSMVNYGSTNTYQAVPNILDQKGYTTAAFHGDVASFWNRDNTYKNWGYDYFFSKPFFEGGDKDNYNIGYGMKDKIFLKESAQYLERLPQPYYAKMITVTNHYPYDLDKENISIEKTETGDKTVDGYVQTARYLDQAFGEFEKYLKDSGMYDNTVLVLYGDHYGISENHPDAIAKLMGKDSVTPYDLANWQKVPFIVHSPGLEGKGGVNHTYGGEIDVMPTLMHLLGISTKNNIQFGQDLLAKDRKEVVPFRNSTFASKDYIKYGGDYYVTSTGTKIDPKEDLRAKQIIDDNQKYVNDSLSYSDQVQTGDLLRFHTLPGYKPDKASDYSYKKSDTMKALEESDKKKPTSALNKNKGKSTEYKTDAPELGGQPQTIDQDDSDDESDGNSDSQ